MTFEPTINELPVYSKPVLCHCRFDFKLFGLSAEARGFPQ